MAHQRKPNVSSNVKSSESPSKQKIKEESSSSPVLILVVGFVLLIGYTVWSSIQTYGNAVYSDME